MHDLIRRLKRGPFVVCVGLSACNGGERLVESRAKAAAFGPTAPATAALHAVATAPGLSKAARVGKDLFFDQALSASGSMSCATCHDPAVAYGPPNALSVQLGGPKHLDPGVRAVPSLMYKEYTPPYADLLDNPDGFSAPGPGGGFAWDGRANTLAEQAAAPLLSLFEMANESPAKVVERVRAASYRGRFLEAFGDHALDDADAAFKDVEAALQAFQLEDTSFHPYTSKFDLHSGNKIGGDFTAAEARGLQVFADPKKGNCSSCHFQGAGLNGSSGLFTDFSYEAIGVPRNASIPANADASKSDLGICGPLRTDHVAEDAKSGRFCGMFKTPTLRNVTLRTAFFHNGVIHSLEQAIRFYATRDTIPELWYPTLGGMPKAVPDPTFPTYGLVTVQYEGGRVAKFDDLLKPYRDNVDSQMPLDGRKRSSKAPLNDPEIKDLICFLHTLTDGYQPGVTPTVPGCTS